MIQVQPNGHLGGNCMTNIKVMCGDPTNKHWVWGAGWGSGKSAHRILEFAFMLFHMSLEVLAPL